MYKFYRTVPVYFGKDDCPTGETASCVYEVPEYKLSVFNKWLNKNGLMVKKGTNRIVKRGFMSRLCDLIRDSLSD